MSEQKLLTICLPTYNRAKYFKIQLERFSSMPQELWRDIRIFISDNCSTDDTKSIGLEYCEKEGVDIVYHRNDSNLGMDGNFITCFKAAESKYVWLLGDDDTIIIEKLPLIINILRGTDIGVLHLGIDRNDAVEYNVFADYEHFVKEIGIWITYISSNIVNTSYVDQIDFEKYYGTFFTLIPLYLRAIICEHSNILLNTRVFENGKDVKRNGGYNYIQVFVANYLAIFKEFVDKGELSERVYEYEKGIAYRFVIPYLWDYVIFEKKSNYITSDSWTIMFNHYGVIKTYLGLLVHAIKRLLRNIYDLFIAITLQRKISTR